jgi:hypothetical protein
MTGDLNAPPDEALHATMAAAGFMSAHKVRCWLGLLDRLQCQ